MSIDGKISTFARRQVRISGIQDMSRVDALRAESDAVMVGIGTVLSDDPSLLVKSEILRRSRLERGLPKNPLRIVVDSLARTPADAKVLGDGCIIAISRSALAKDVAKLSGRCEIVRFGDARVDLKELMSALYEKGVRRLMVEGGATLNWSLTAAGLVDEIYVYIGNMLIGGKDTPTLVDGVGFSENFPRFKLTSIERMDEGALLRWSILRDHPANI